jgi:hypothetical protein
MTNTNPIHDAEAIIRAAREGAEARVLDLGHIHAVPSADGDVRVIDLAKPEHLFQLGLASRTYPFPYQRRRRICKACHLRFTTIEVLVREDGTMNVPDKVFPPKQFPKASSLPKAITDRPGRLHPAWRLRSSFWQWMAIRGVSAYAPVPQRHRFVPAPIRVVLPDPRP